jgi:hypothetical protein
MLRRVLEARSCKRMMLNLGFKALITANLEGRINDLLTDNENLIE